MSKGHNFRVTGPNGLQKGKKYRPQREENKSYSFYFRLSLFFLLCSKEELLYVGLNIKQTWSSLSNELGSIKYYEITHTVRW